MNAKLPASMDTEENSENNSGTDASIGSLLRASRNRRNEELSEVSSSLRIRQVYLEAIENNQFEELPGAIYAIGFIRTYAEYLGLDGEEVIRRYKTETATAENKQDLTFPSLVPEHGIPGGAIVMLGLLLAAIGYGSWYFVSSRNIFVTEQVPAVPEKLAALVGEKPVATEPLKKVEEPVQSVVEAPAPEDKPEDKAASTTENTPETAADKAVKEVVAAAEKVEDKVEEKIEEKIADAQPSAPEKVETPADVEKKVEAVVAEAAKPAAEEIAKTETPEPAPSAAPEVKPETAKPVQVAATPEPAAEPEAKPESEPESGATPKPIVKVAEKPVEKPAEKPPAEPVTAEVEKVVPKRAPEVAALPEKAPAPEPAATPTPQPSAAAGSSRITLRAISDSYIQVRDNDADQLLITRLLKRGQSYHVPDRTGLSLITGNAGALEILVDGTAVPSIGPIGVVRRNVVLEADKLVNGLAVVE